MLVNRWKKLRTPLETKLDNLDDLFESKTGIDIPDPWQEWYHRIVTGGVAALDKLMCSREVMNELVRFAISGGKSNSDKLIKMIGAWWANVDPWKPIEEQIPEDLKPVFNDFKKQMANKFVTAQLQLAAPGVKAEVALHPIFNKSKEEIDKDVEQAVIVNKLLKKDTVLPGKNPQETWNALAEASRARQAALLANSTSK